MKIAFVFRHSPYGSAISREGLDALLAASAFCDEDQISVFFLDDGVLNLVSEQKSELILQKDISNPLKLLDLYEIEQRYLCRQSWLELGLGEQVPSLDVEMLERAQIIALLQQAEKLQIF